MDLAREARINLEFRISELGFGIGGGISDLGLSQAISTFGFRISDLTARPWTFEIRNSQFAIRNLLPTRFGCFADASKDGEKRV